MPNTMPAIIAAQQLASFPEAASQRAHLGLLLLFSLPSKWSSRRWLFPRSSSSSAPLCSLSWLLLGLECAVTPSPKPQARATHIAAPWIYEAPTKPSVLTPSPSQVNPRSFPATVNRPIVGPSSNSSSTEKRRDEAKGRRCREGGDGDVHDFESANIFQAYGKPRCIPIDFCESFFVVTT